jgi:hypothetical protein
MLRRSAISAAGGAALAGVVEMGTYPLWRDWCLTWGTTDGEATASLPGDDLMADPEISTTRAIGIHAPPSAIWPWLAQMGPGRGGLYTYDWIENLFGLDIHSVDVVLPEFQDVKVGDTQTVGTNGPKFHVAMCDRDGALVFQSEDGNWIWAFILRADGEGSRLISRNMIKLPEASWGTRWMYKYVMEPGSLVMERKMLFGIKARAERLAREQRLKESR